MVYNLKPSELPTCVEKGTKEVPYNSIIVFCKCVVHNHYGHEI